MDPYSSFLQFDTAMVRPRERFEFWRSLHPQAKLDPLEREDAAAFDARIGYFVGADGMMFGHDEVHDNFIANFAQPQGDFLMFSSTVAGTANIEVSGSDGLHVAAGSAPVAIDVSRPVRVTCHGFDQLVLMVPLPLLRRELCSDKWPPKAGLSPIAAQRLTPFLLAQMQQMAQIGASLSAPELQAAMQALKALVIGVLEQAEPGEITRAEGLPDDSIHVAAQQYIALNFARTDLSAERIAMAVGCSRAKLFRVFEEHGETLGTVIRTKRLALAKQLLPAEPDMPVKLVAHRCGYRSVEAFTRAFRAEFDMTPGEYRHIGQTQV
ncbi:MAG: AraC family transcriptional regulator [Maritimibacter sp.]